MRRLFALVLLVPVAGCSNAPIAGFLDCVAPARGGAATGGGTRHEVPDVRPPAANPDALPPPADTIPPVGPR